ncbi:MAG TPA: ADP-ribosylglycohydrolase family protein [bacterium]|nr:ADP-ribosylglycohydrolase family protein [bacterium]
MNPSLDQFAGCFIGQCLGDALGFAVEGYPPAVCQQYVHDILRRSPQVTAAHRLAEFGQYTDDSQLARELMSSYVTMGRFDPADYASRIAAIFHDKRIVGKGLATEEAAFRLLDGVHWSEAGARAPSAGNGSAMRAAPIGLIFWDHPEDMIQAAHDQGRITHQDPRCSAGAVVIAGAVSLALQRESRAVSGWTAQLARWARSFDPILADGVEQLEALVALEPDEAVRIISRIGIDSDYVDGWKWISPFVTTSVLWSLYAFLRTPDDYWQTVSTAIAVGGDVDTTAAMAGAVSGAYLGLEQLPRSLTSRLNDQRTWSYHELVELAERCLAQVLQAGSLPG